MTRDTQALIDTLSKDAAVRTAPASTTYLTARLFLLITVYAVGVQAFLGIRPDIADRLSDSAYVIEIALLAGIVLSGGLACMFIRYPDHYQHSAWVRLPYLLSAALIGLMLYGLTFGTSAPDTHAAFHMTFECASCIGMTAILPAALLFVFIRKGATVTRYQAGWLAVITAGAIGCLTLRLAEPADALEHMLFGHYASTLAFALIGALLGGRLLRW